MKKELLVLLLASSLLLFLTGCTLFPTGPREMPIPEVYVGTTALELSFLQGAPPAEVFEGGSFEITIDVQNTGAYDVERGLYSLVLEEQYMSLFEEGKQTGSFYIKGRSIYDPVGGRQRLVFRTRADPLPEQVERYPATIIFNACYAYKTTATAQVCIDTDLAGIQAVKVCTPTTTSMSGGQGGPVSITSVESKMLPYEDGLITPTFIIYIENQGNGQVVDTNAIGEACGAKISKTFGREAFNRITRLTAALTDQTLICRPDKIILTPMEATRVVCEATNPIGPERGTYTTPLSIEIDYGYVNSITTTTTITKMV